MTYTVDHFIKKFEAIPDELWCFYVYDEGEKCCVLGHCGAFSPECDSLIILFEPESIVLINDGKDPRYQQPTPKARILAALRDLKEKETK